MKPLHQATVFSSSSVDVEWAQRICQNPPRIWSAMKNEPEVRSFSFAPVRVCTYYLLCIVLVLAERIRRVGQGKTRASVGGRSDFCGGGEREFKYKSAVLFSAASALRRLTLLLLRDSPSPPPPSANVICACPLMVQYCVFLFYFSCNYGRGRPGAQKVLIIFKVSRGG